MSRRMLYLTIVSVEDPEYHPYYPPCLPPCLPKKIYVKVSIPTSTHTKSIKTPVARKAAIEDNGAKWEFHNFPVELEVFEDSADQYLHFNLMSSNLLRDLKIAEIILPLNILARFQMNGDGNPVKFGRYCNIKDASGNYLGDFHFKYSFGESIIRCDWTEDKYYEIPNFTCRLSLSCGCRLGCATPQILPSGEVCQLE